MPFQSCVRIRLPSSRNSDREPRALFPHVRQAEEEQGSARARLEMSLHRGDLGGLVLERVQAVQVARHDLQRSDQRGHPHRHREHDSRGRLRRIPQQVQRAGPANDEGRRQVCSQQHVHQAIREGRIEYHRPPVERHELPDVVNAVTGGRLHPAVDREDPERRHEGAERDHQRGHEVQPRTDAFQPEQHDAEKAGLEEERGQHLVAHQWADDRAGLVGEHAPVGAELVAHDDAGDDAHAEGDCEDLLPVIEEIEEHRTTGQQPETLEDRKIARQADRDRREHDVEAHREGELESRERKRVWQFH